MCINNTLTILTFFLVQFINLLKERFRNVNINNKMLSLVIHVGGEGDDFAGKYCVNGLYYFISA